MKKTTLFSILLIGAILLVVNVLSQKFSFSLDATDDNQHTLSNATEDILQGLEDPVTITAYFSDNLPPDLLNLRRSFNDMLIEYRDESGGMVDFRFVSPNKNPEAEQEALQSGIRPLTINVREKDQAKAQKAFLGAVLKMGEQTEYLPAIVSPQGMEYDLSTAIKKMSVVNKPSIGIVQGHGEPPLQDLSQAYQSLSILYSVEVADLGGDLSRFKTIALVAPKDSIPVTHFAALDQYLEKGGNLFVAIDRVTGDLQSQQGTVVNTGLETWLQSKGITVEPSFILDASCGTVTVQQKQGFFMMNTPVQFPYLPMIRKFTGHEITEGLEQVILAFASPVSYTGKGTFTPILQSSEQSASSPAPTTFQVMDKQWTVADFPQSNINIGGFIEGETLGNIVVIGDGDFPVSGQGRGANPDNVNLMVNSIDYLSDDTGLIELRTKGITTRPIEQAYLGDENAGKRNMMKYLNFGLPIVLVFMLGFIRSQREKSKRASREAEDFS